MMASLWTQLHRRSVPAARNARERILSAAVLVGSITAAVKLAGAAKVAVMAKYFGTGDQMDAFLVAFLLPSFVAEVLAASFSAALIPAFIEARECEGLDSAKELLSGVLAWTVALLVVGTFALAALSHWIVVALGSGFSPATLALAQSLFLVLSPVFVLSGISATWRAVLNAGERFALPALAPGMTPLVTILLLSLVGRAWGAYTLAYGAVIGTLLEVALIGATMKRQGYPLLPRRTVANPHLRQIGEQYTPLLAAAAISGGSVLVDQAMAAMLGPGSVSVLGYGIKITNVLLVVGTTAISTAVLPHFSALAARRRWVEMQRMLRTYVRGILAAGVPIVAVLVLLAEPLTRVLLERGEFTGGDTRMVAAVQHFSLPQVPVCMAGILVVRLISAVKANWLLPQGAIMNLAINAVFNAIFMRFWGVSGIALSTTLSNLISYSYLYFRMCRILGRISMGQAATVVP